MSLPEEIFEYLPISYKTQDESNYVSFLWESFELNYEHEKYQFAFIAYHLLFMAYVYFQLWKIYASHNENFRRSILGFQSIIDLFDELEEKNQRNRESGLPLEQFYPFQFSKENERTVMSFFRLIGCDKAKIGRYKKLIDERNKIAHASGEMIFVAGADLDRKIDDVLRLVREIHEHSKATTKEIFLGFLSNDSSPDTREYIEDADQLEEVLIRGNYISPRDLEDFALHPLDEVETPEIQPLIDELYSRWEKLGLDEA